MTPTPTPWRVDEFFARTNILASIGPRGTAVVAKARCVSLDEETQQSNAAFIVRAVNSHDELVAALNAMCSAYGNCGTILQQRASDLARAALVKAEAA